MSKKVLIKNLKNKIPCKRRDCSASQKGNKLKVNVIMIVVMKRSIFMNFYNTYISHEIFLMNTDLEHVFFLI